MWDITQRKGNKMVSVIVPVYNAEEKLEQCIMSILNQSYQDLELILINDGSKDRSGEICKKYAEYDKRIRYIERENKGASATRNEGISLALGQYIQFVDSDDYIEKNMTERLVNCIEETDADMVMCGYTEVFPHDKDVRLPEIDKTITMAELGKEYPNIFEKFLLNSPCNKLYKKEKLSEKFPENLSLGEDLIFNLHNMENMNRISFVKESFYNYIIRQESLNRQYRKDGIEIAERLYLESMEFCKAFYLGKAAETHISNIFMTFFFYGLTDLFTISGCDKKEKKEILNSWMQNPNIQKAAAHADVRRKVQKVAVFLVKYKMTKALEGLFILKSFSRR